MSKPSEAGRSLTHDELYYEKETSDGKWENTSSGSEQRVSEPITSRHYYVNTSKFGDGKEILKKKGKYEENKWIKVNPLEAGRFDAGAGIEFKYEGEDVRVYGNENIFLADKPLISKTKAPAESATWRFRGMDGGRRRRKTRSKRKSRKTRRRY